MSETPVLLTAAAADQILKGGDSLIDFWLEELQAIASGQVVCIAAERLAELRTALEMTVRALSEYTSTCEALDYAREALAAQEVGNG